MLGAKMLAEFFGKGSSRGIDRTPRVLSETHQIQKSGVYTVNISILYVNCLFVLMEDMSMYWWAWYGFRW